MSPRIKLSPLGFTMIELLLGILIFSIISLALFSSFVSAVHLSKRVSGTQQRAFDVLMAFNAMQKDINSFIPMHFSSDRGSVLDIEGSSDRISFWIDPGRGIKRVTYFLAPMNDKNEDDLQWLIRREHIFKPDQQGAIAKEAKEQVVIGNILPEGFVCRYGLMGEENKLRWEKFFKHDGRLIVLECSLALQQADMPQKPLSIKRRMYFLPLVLEKK